MQAMRLQTKLYGWKAFPFDQECFWNFQPEILPKWKVPLVSGLRIATKSIQQSFGPKWEYMSTKLELLTISSDKLNMLWPSFTLGSNMYLVFFLDACECHTLPLPKTSQAQIWNQNIHSCQSPAGILRPSISFALVLIFLFSRPPHLILLSTLTNPIFIFTLTHSLLEILPKNAF